MTEPFKSAEDRFDEVLEALMRVVRDLDDYMVDLRRSLPVWREKGVQAHGLGIRDTMSIPELVDHLLGGTVMIGNLTQLAVNYHAVQAHRDDFSPLMRTLMLQHMTALEQELKRVQEAFGLGDFKERYRPDPPKPDPNLTTDGWLDRLKKSFGGS